MSPWTAKQFRSKAVYARGIQDRPKSVRPSNQASGPVVEFDHGTSELELIADLLQEDPQIQPGDEVGEPVEVDDVTTREPDLFADLLQEDPQTAPGDPAREPVVAMKNVTTRYLESTSNQLQKPTAADSAASAAKSKTAAERLQKPGSHSNPEGGNLMSAPLSCPDLIPDTAVEKILAFRVVNECLDTECEDVLFCLSQFLGSGNCTDLHDIVIDQVSLSNIVIEANIIGTNQVGLHKKATIIVNYHCTSDGATPIPRVLTDTIDFQRIVPLSGAQPGTALSLFTIPVVQIVGFRFEDTPTLCPPDNKAFIVSVGFFVVLKLVKMIDMCVNAVPQTIRPPSCSVGPTPCDSFLDPANLQRIWEQVINDP